MARKVLLAYATRYGSTEEVARTVAAKLEEGGLSVEVQPVKKVRSLEGNDAVVLGTPIFIGSLLKDARRFLDKHQAELEKLPVAVFALGPIRAGEEMLASRGQLETALTKVPWLVPVDSEVFVGRYDPDRLGMGDKMLTALPASPLHGVPAQDDRDWDAIEAWAAKLAERLAA
jgi:menaquinone-dependent protoporphyrinogen oxidase